MAGAASPADLRIPDTRIASPQAPGEDLMAEARWRLRGLCTNTVQQSWAFVPYGLFRPAS